MVKSAVEINRAKPMDYPGLPPLQVQVQNKADNLMCSTSAEDADDLS